MQFLLILHIHSTVLHSAAAVTLVSSFWNLGWQRTIYLEHHQSLQQRERKTCTIQMLALKASAQKLHISGHTLISQSKLHGHSRVNWVGIYNPPPGRGTGIFGTSDTIYHRHFKQNTSKPSAYCFIPIQSLFLPQCSFSSVTWHHCILSQPS